MNPEKLPPAVTRELLELQLEDCWTPFPIIDGKPRLISLLVKILNLMAECNFKPGSLNNSDKIIFPTTPIEVLLNLKQKAGVGISSTIA